jgi:hypothetical protein
MIPNVYIVQPSFIFSPVTPGGEADCLMTFQNDSELNAKVIINLNTQNLKDFKVIII